jgi:thiamine pyrophosphokinase
MHSVIFCNGALSIAPQHLSALIASADLLIAADGGCHHLKSLSISPNIIIGDMDSIDVKDHPTIETIRFDSNKNQTDTELAIIEALNRGSKKITLLAATGRRIDHTIGNIELIKKYAGLVSLIENDRTLVALKGPATLQLNGEVGNIVSLFSAETRCPCITTSGLKYNLNNEKLLFPTHGVSNEIEKNPSSISIETGLLLVCVNNCADSIVKNTNERII